MSNTTNKWKKYKKINIIETGTYGKVDKVHNIQTGYYFAIKKLIKVKYIINRY